MTRTGTQSLMMMGAFVALILVAALSVIDFDSDGATGAAVGAGLGLLNLAVGYVVTQRALQRGMKSAVATLAGGFIARLVVVVSLMLMFRQTDSVDPTAFALTFLVFFFVYLGLEVLLVERQQVMKRRAL